MSDHLLAREGFVTVCTRCGAREEELNNSCAERLAEQNALLNRQVRDQQAQLQALSHPVIHCPGRGLYVLHRNIELQRDEAWVAMCQRHGIEVKGAP